MPIPADPPVYRYTVAPMPPSRIGRRWRWTLWEGERLLAAGWRMSERRALQGLRAAAARAVHEEAGLSVLRPERTWGETTFLPGATVRLEAGALACVLQPRARAAAEAA